MNKNYNEENKERMLKHEMFEASRLFRCGFYSFDKLKEMAKDLSEKYNVIIKAYFMGANVLEIVEN